MAASALAQYEVVVTSPADGTDAGSDAAAGSPEAATPSPSPCPASSAEPTEDRPVLERFFCAAQRGNLEQLGAILMADETLDLAVTNEVNWPSTDHCAPCQPAYSMPCDRL